MCSVPRIFMMYICLGISFNPDMGAGLFGGGGGEVLWLCGSQQQRGREMARSDGHSQGQVLGLDICISSC